MSSLHQEHVGSGSEVSRSGAVEVVYRAEPVGGATMRIESQDKQAARVRRCLHTSELTNLG
jgi:hypothetical protein